MVVRHGVGIGEEGDYHADREEIIFSSGARSVYYEVRRRTLADNCNGNEYWAERCEHYGSNGELQYTIEDVHFHEYDCPLDLFADD